MSLLVQLPNLASARRLAPGGGLWRGRGVRLSVSAAAPGGGVKEEEEEEEEEEEKGTRRKGRIVIRVLDPVRERRIPPPLFSSPDAPSSEPPAARRRKGGDNGEDRRRRYYVNVGDAIRTLREELPAAFYREPSFHIYRDDIAFKDPINNFTGIDNYKRIFWALRFTGKIFFKALWIDIVSIWQPVEDVIMIRWIVHGIPRVLLDGPGRFEGTSEYKFDKNGKIYEHKVDNVARNSSTKFKVLPVAELIRSLGCPSTPKPTYFETSPLQLISLLPFWFKLTWMRCSLSLYLILANLSK